MAQVGPMIRLLAFVDGLLGFYVMILLVTVIVRGWSPSTSSTSGTTSSDPSFTRSRHLLTRC